MSIRRSARLQGESPAYQGLDEQSVKEIRREKREIRNQEKEKEQAEYDAKLEEWRNSMEDYYNQRNEELEQRKTWLANLRNPIAFHADRWGYEFLDKGGVVEQYRTECLIVGKTYYRIIVDTYHEEHPDVTCEEAGANDIQLVYHTCFRFHLNDLPPNVLSLPWMKPWTEDSDIHSKCAGRIHYTVREIVKFVQPITYIQEQEAQSQW